jgi:hypothetical protein
MTEITKDMGENGKMDKTNKNRIQELVHDSSGRAPSTKNNNNNDKIKARIQ